MKCYTLTVDTSVALVITKTKTPFSKCILTFS